MCRRIPLSLAAVMLTGAALLSGCRSGGGSGLMHSSNFLSGLTFGNRAPLGQSEPEIVLRDEKSASDDRESSNEGNEF